MTQPFTKKCLYQGFQISIYEIDHGYSKYFGFSYEIISPKYSAYWQDNGRIFILKEKINLLHLDKIEVNFNLFCYYDNNEIKYANVEDFYKFIETLLLFT